MQTDPNLANYRYSPETGQIVLLDFGAVTYIDPALTGRFRHLLDAAFDGDTEKIRAAMQDVGYINSATTPRHQAQIMAMFDVAMAPLRLSAPFDFGKSDLVLRLREMGMELGRDRDLAHVPPPETLFLHRKIAGIYLVAAMLKARVALAPLVSEYRVQRG